MPSELDMNVIMPTRTMRYDGGDVPEDWGVSGFVIIAESHLSIHTFPDKGFFAFDAFSCKPFDLRSAIVRVVDFFGCSRYEHKVFDRGREFPRCPDRSQQIVHGERQQAMQCR
jgi:S-adenosylmethionine decarboxylase